MGSDGGGGGGGGSGGGSVRRRVGYSKDGLSAEHMQPINNHLNFPAAVDEAEIK